MGSFAGVFFFAAVLVDFPFLAFVLTADLVGFTFLTDAAETFLLSPLFLTAADIAAGACFFFDATFFVLLCVAFLVTLTGAGSDAGVVPFMSSADAELCQQKASSVPMNDVTKNLRIDIDEPPKRIVP